MWILYNLINNYIIITVVTVYYNVYISLQNFSLVYLPPKNALQAYHASGHGGLSDSLSHYILQFFLNEMVTVLNGRII